MKQYLLSIYQPDGDPPPAEVLEEIARAVRAVDDEMRAAGVWVFAGGCTPPRRRPSSIPAATTCRCSTARTWRARSTSADS